MTTNINSVNKEVPLSVGSTQEDIEIKHSSANSSISGFTNNVNPPSLKKPRPRVSNLDEIKQALSIQRVLQGLGITIADSDKKINCPLPDHDEKTPSFSIYNNDKLWQCFGQCSTGGDSIRLIQKLLNCTYIEAVNKAGELSGITPVFSNISKEEIESMQNESKLHDLFEALTELFYISLYNTEGRTGLVYLNKRHVENSYIKNLKIGYSPNTGFKEEIINIAEDMDISISTLVESGLLHLDSEDKDVIPTTNNTNSALRDCITFPIIVNDRVVGFIGRRVWDTATAKYIKVGNFGLWNADVVLDDKEAFVTEGIFDALSAMQTGISNVCALLGVNALKEDEANILKKASKIYLYLDSDDAGVRASIKIAERLGHRAFIVEGTTAGKTKDLNGLFDKMWEQEKENIDIIEWEAAYERLLRDIKAVLDSKISQAKNLIEIKFEEWKEIEDETERLDKLSDVITLAYQQYDGNPALLEKFGKALKEFKITSKVFNEFVKQTKKTIGDKNKKYYVEHSEWEVIDNILYRTVLDRQSQLWIQKEICTTPPSIEKILRNTQSNLSETQISFTDKRGRFRFEVISDSNTKKGLLDALKGTEFDINEGNAAHLMDYIRYLDIQLGANAEESNLVERFGWHNEYSSFVIGYDTIGEQSIVFQGAGPGEQSYAKKYTAKGNLEGWKEIIPLISDKKWMMLELYSSFLPPLLPILESSNLIISNYGNTSQGKTLTNRVACSVWASTNQNTKDGTALYDGLGMTLDKLEKSIAMLTHVPMFINDTHMLKDSVKSLLTYMMESSHGKGRGGLNRGSQLDRVLRTTLFATSESPLVSDGASRNKGELARVIEFHGSPVEKNDIMLVEKINNIINSHYGHAGRLFVQKLIDLKGDFDNIKSQYNQIRTDTIDTSQSNILNSLIPNASAIIVAGILADEFLGLGLGKDKIKADIMNCLETIKEDTELDMEAYHISALRVVSDFFVVNKNSFYYKRHGDSSDPECDDKNEFLVYGKEKYGIWREDVESPFIAVNKTILDDYLKKHDVDPTRCYKGWKNDEYIETNSKGYTKSVYDPQTKASPQMVKFPMSGLKEFLGEVIKIDYPVPRNLRVVSNKDIKEVFGV